MKILAIAGSRVPSDTANSMQVMKACSAIVQLGYDLTLLVPANPQLPVTNYQSHYGLPNLFPIEWLSGSSRRFFTFNAIRHALTYKPDLIYTWFPQSAVFGLLAHKPVIFEAHLQPTGRFGPAWHRAFARLPGRKRLACITYALKLTLEEGYHMRMRPADVVVAPNGVELGNCSP
jgi:hypothetical protein